MSLRRINFARPMCVITDENTYNELQDTGGEICEDMLGLPIYIDKWIVPGSLNLMTIEDYEAHLERTKKVVLLGGKQ